MADLELDAGRHRAYRGGKRIDLTAKEFALLHLLMRRAGEALTRTQIASAVWDINFDSDTNVVEVARSRAQGGTGLGLAIVRSVMPLHGGAAEVASAPGGLTRFILRFPRGRAQYGG